MTKEEFLNMAINERLRVFKECQCEEEKLIQIIKSVSCHNDISRPLSKTGHEFYVAQAKINSLKTLAKDLGERWLSPIFARVDNMTDSEVNEFRNKQIAKEKMELALVEERLRNSGDKEPEIISDYRKIKRRLDRLMTGDIKLIKEIILNVDGVYREDEGRNFYVVMPSDEKKCVIPAKLKIFIQKHLDVCERLVELLANREYSADRVKEIKEMTGLDEREFMFLTGKSKQEIYNVLFMDTDYNKQVLAEVDKRIDEAAKEQTDLSVEEMDNLHYNNDGFTIGKCLELENNATKSGRR